MASTKLTDRFAKTAAPPTQEGRAYLMYYDSVVRGLIDAALFTGADDNIAALVLIAEKADEGATQPARRGGRMKQSSKPMIDLPEMRGTLGSAPEILITNVEEELGDDDEPQITVVPAEGGTPTLMDAFAGLRMKRPRSVRSAPSSPLRPLTGRATRTDSRPVWPRWVLRLPATRLPRAGKRC